MLKAEAKKKMKGRLELYCEERTCDNCIFNDISCNFQIKDDVSLLKCYDKWLYNIIHESLLEEVNENENRT